MDREKSVKTAGSVCSLIENSKIAQANSSSWNKCRSLVHAELNVTMMRSASLEFSLEWSLLGSSSGPGGLGHPALGPLGTLWRLGLLGCSGSLGFLGTLCLSLFLGGLLGCWTGTSSCFLDAGSLNLFRTWLLLFHHLLLPRCRGLLVQLEGTWCPGALDLDQCFDGHQASDGEENSGFVLHHVVSSSL